MKIRCVLTVMSLVCFAVLTACGGSETAINPEASEAPVEPAQNSQAAAAPAELFVAGQLQEVDGDAMTLVLKDAQGAEQQFVFSPNTRITGIPRPEDLRNQEGRNATIRYIDRDNVKSAVQIHIEIGS
jgi:hypothetical protein